MGFGACYAVGRAALLVATAVSSSFAPFALETCVSSQPLAVSKSVPCQVSRPWGLSDCPLRACCWGGSSALGGFHVRVLGSELMKVMPAASLNVLSAM